MCIHSEFSIRSSNSGSNMDVSCGCLRETEVPSVREELSSRCDVAAIEYGNIHDLDFSILVHLLLDNSVWGGWFIPRYVQAWIAELRNMRTMIPDIPQAAPLITPTPPPEPPILS